MNETNLDDLFGKPQDELIRLADQHTKAVQAWLASRSPQAAKYVGKGIRLSSTGLQVPLLNLALGCNFPGDASDNFINDEIENVKAFFARRGVPWLWWVAPHASPANLTPFLKENGITTEPRKLPAMIAPVGAKTHAMTKNGSGIKVWRAKTEADLQAASHIRHQAFRFPAGEALHYFEDMQADWLLDSSPARLYLAGRQIGSPAAIGAVIEGAGLPGIYIMATLPDSMRQGFGKAVLIHLLQQIESEYDENGMVVLTASRFGFPLYSQFGFKHLFDYSIYAPAD
jgi:GNAT superfamily N-acetyltransferase